MKRALAYAAVMAALVVILVAAGNFFQYHQQVKNSSNTQIADLRILQLRGESIRVSIADTDATREKGLGGRSGLASDEGMLFIFPKDGIYAFWMKDMQFSIDIVWLSAEGRVVYIAQNVSPSTYPRDFVPESPARYVLELPAGYCLSHGVQVGDIVRL